MLIMPPVNITYFEHEATMSMMKNMEFMSDRYLFGSVAWDLSGKLLNRIPLVKRLKWREYFAVKGMWSTVTSKNDPTLQSNQSDRILFQFPEGVGVMNKKVPYWEVVVGVHNIFKFFGVDYVRRMNYHGPGIHKNGVRFGFMMSF